MKKTTLGAAILTVPLLIIAGREAGKLFASIEGTRPAGPSPALWIGGILLTLVLLWVGVVLWNRAAPAKKGGVSFEMVAAMAIAEAKKRPAAGACARCGRRRLSESAPRCLYCGTAFAPAAEPVPHSS